MPYQIKQLEDNILQLNFTGFIGDEDAVNHAKELDDYLADSSAQNPMHFLIITYDMGKVSAKSRQSFAQRNQDLRVGKSAVVGANRILRVLSLFILKASGRDNIRLFDDEKEALAWLKTEEKAKQV